MTSVPKRVADRLSKQIGRFQKVLRNAKDRDVGESDTVTIITDMLADLFGYAKYSEITSELAIRGTYCDLAVMHDGKIGFLIEVKAIGLTLKENHLRQAMNYGANQGVPWVVLTNGVHWEIYRIKVDKRVDCEHICSIDMLELNARKAQDAERLYLLCKEGLAKAAIEHFREHTQIVNRFTVAAIIRSEPLLQVMRREIRRLSPGAKISTSEIRDLLPDVLKRDVVEGEAARNAERRVNKACGKSLRKRRRKASASKPGDGEAGALGAGEN